MPRLGETTALLKSLRQQTQSRLGEHRSDTPFVETTDFGANPGALRMLSYAPGSLPDGAPLVVVLHGCTQGAAAHAVAAGWVTLADRCGFAVVAPEQAPANNANRCFNWFEPGDIARGGGEAASIKAMVDRAVAQHRLDSSRIYVTGLSAGGAMAMVMLAAYPEVFAGGGIVAGLPYGVAGDVQSAFGAMRGQATRSPAQLAALLKRAGAAGDRLPRVAIWQGDADHTVVAANAGQIAGQWAAARGLPPEAAETEVLHRRTRSLWRDADGRTVIECNLVHGLGHGTPLATLGPEGIGAVAPYMLEAGVSAPLEIARFWGLADAAAASAPARPAEAPASRPRTGLGEDVVAVIARHVPANVQDVIARALKSAGLMK